MSLLLARMELTSAKAQSLVYWLKWAILLTWIPLTLYFLFVSPLPAVHNNVHSFRHTFANMPCH